MHMFLCIYNYNYIHMYLHGHIFKGMKENSVSKASGMCQVIVCDDNRKGNFAMPYDYCSFIKPSGLLSTQKNTALILKGISNILFRSHSESPWPKCTDLGYPKIPFSNVKVASWSCYNFTIHIRSWLPCLHTSSSLLLLTFIGSSSLRLKFKDSELEFHIWEYMIFSCGHVPKYSIMASNGCWGKWLICPDSNNHMEIILICNTVWPIT